MNVKIKTDDRGVEYATDADLEILPAGWALCNTCHRAWNDEKSTSVTPVPAGRCPFENEHVSDDPKERLEELRAVLRAENISYGELAELQGLAEHIDKGDIELLEAAGVPENETRAERAIRELKEACEYDEDGDSTIDSLIDYKNALEDAYATLLASTPEPSENDTSLTWSGEASDGFPDRINTMRGWYVRLTTLDGTRIEASIVGHGLDVEIDGTTWNDAVTYLPVDDDGIALDDAEPQTVRVREVYIY